MSTVNQDRPASGLSRRRFIQSSATATGGMALGFNIPLANAASDAPKPWEIDEVGAEINAWLVIAEDNSVTIRVAQSEMGEGVFTSMPMIVAEELDCDWEDVRAEYASANRSVRENRVYQRMSTGGSGAVRRSRVYLQQAGASARERLKTAAANRWGVAVDECTTGGGRVFHRDSGREATYGELAADAAQVRLDAEPAIRTNAEFRLLGVPHKRLDVPAKVDGSATYGIDVRVPGMVYATVKACPVWGGTLKSVDKAPALESAGVTQVIEMDDAVVVVADTFWHAKKGADALAPEWNLGEFAEASSAEWLTEWRDDVKTRGVVAHEEGDAYAALKNARHRIEADYDAPYLAHLCMEPINCTVHVQDDRVDVWTGTQNAESALAAAAEISGKAPSDVHVHTCFLGGGFGRRSQPNFIRRATAIAMQVDAPVQVIWTREEDTATGHFRPLATMRFEAGFDRDRKPVAFLNRSATHSIVAGFRPEVVDTGIDGSSVEGLDTQPYAFPNIMVEHHLKRTFVPVHWWRSVGHSQNCFAMESFTDEMAEMAGMCPYRFRHDLLVHRPDIRRVLDVAAEAASWGRAMPKGSAQGIAVSESFGSICAQVAEVTVSKDGKLKVDRVVVAIDCGNVVNPLTIEEQVESAIVYGLTAAMWGRQDIEAGRVSQLNFDRNRMLKMAEMPEVETHLALSLGDKWGGVGEPGLPPIAPAVTNAIYRATGKRIRSLPLSRHDLSWS